MAFQSVDESLEDLLNKCTLCFFQKAPFYPKYLYVQIPVEPSHTHWLQACGKLGVKLLL